MEAGAAAWPGGGWWEGTCHSGSSLHFCSPGIRRSREGQERPLVRGPPPPRHTAAVSSLIFSSSPAHCGLTRRRVKTCHGHVALERLRGTAPAPRSAPCCPSRGPSPATPPPAPPRPRPAPQPSLPHCCPCPWRPPSLLNSVHPRLPQRCPSALSMALCPFLFISWNSTGRQAL